MGIISWLVVGAIAGWLAGLLVKGDERFGVIGHIVLGIVGALVGGFIAGHPYGRQRLRLGHQHHDDRRSHDRCGHRGRGVQRHHGAHPDR